MQLIWVLGQSASGKTTLIKRILSGVVLVHKSLGISPNSRIDARLSNFGNKDICNTSSEDMAKSLIKLPLDVVLIKGQNNYKDINGELINGFEILEKLAEHSVGRGNSIRLILLFPPAVNHAGWYWEKYKDNEKMWKKGDTVLRLLGKDGKGIDDAGKWLENNRKIYLKKAEYIQHSAKTYGIDCFIEIRDSSLLDYPIVTGDT
jgi:hypothetical protein